MEADPDRLTGPTSAWAAEPPDPAGMAFNPVHGFTTQDVMRDQRFRVRLQCIVMALGDSGMHHSLVATGYVW